MILRETGGEDTLLSLFCSQYFSMFTQLTVIQTLFVHHVLTPRPRSTEGERTLTVLQLCPQVLVFIVLMESVVTFAFSLKNFLDVRRLTRRFARLSLSEKLLFTSVLFVNSLFVLPAEGCCLLSYGGAIFKRIERHCGGVEGTCCKTFLNYFL